MDNNAEHQIIPDASVVDICERLLTNLGNRPHPRGFIESEYMLLLMGAPAADTAMAEAYADASLLNSLNGTPVPVELGDSHSGYGIAHINPVVTSMISRHIGTADMGIPRLLTVLNSLVDSGTPGVDSGTPGVECRAYRDTAVVVLVYHRKTAGGDNLLVVEYIRHNGLAEGTALPSMFTIRQCDPMDDTANAEGDTQHMIIPEGWYPLLPATGPTHRCGHYDIERMMPVAHMWGHQPVRGGRA